MKIAQEHIEKGQEIFEDLVQKAWKSSTFKEQLVKTPKETINNLYGENLKINSKIVVADQTDTSKIYLNIPRKIDIEELELTDDQLELVAGGDGKWLGELLHGAWHLGLAVASATLHGAAAVVDHINANT